jgi:hypothetical protein
MLSTSSAFTSAKAMTHTAALSGGEARFDVIINPLGTGPDCRPDRSPEVRGKYSVLRDNNWLRVPPAATDPR